MSKTTKNPTGINGTQYAPTTLAAARLIACDLAGLVAYSPKHGWLTRETRDAQWSMKAAEAVMTRRAIAALRLAGYTGPTPRPRVRAVLTAARQLPGLPTPPAGDLAHLTPRR